MYNTIEHNTKTKNESKMIKNFIDKELSLEFEEEIEDYGYSENYSTIMIFGGEYEDFEKIRSFCNENYFLKD